MMAGIYRKDLASDLAVRELFAELFASNVISTALLPVRKAGLNQVFPALMSSSDSLEQVYPFAPVMPVSTSIQLSKITRFSNPEKTIAVLLRPCESRAAVELVKLKQINLENVLLITRDCPGTVSSEDFEAKAQDSIPSFSEFSDDQIRPVCRMCSYPEAPVADINIGIFGAEAGIILEAKTEKGEEVLKLIKLDAELTDLSSRESALKAETEKRSEYSNKHNTELKKETAGINNLVKLFAKCVNCHNCRTMCPVCYCNECFFDSSTFHFEGTRYEEWVNRRGVLQMPRDEMLFHLGRMNHIGLSCVGCGMCEQACPHDIKVGQLFTLISTTAQKELDIHAGLSLSDPLPLATYREEEFSDMGEEKA